jgi:hypothetical protein
VSGKKQSEEEELKKAAEAAIKILRDYPHLIRQKRALEFDVEFYKEQREQEEMQMEINFLKDELHKQDLQVQALKNHIEEFGTVGFWDMWNRLREEIKEPINSNCVSCSVVLEMVQAMEDRRWYVNSERVKEWNKKFK